MSEHFCHLFTGGLSEETTARINKALYAAGVDARVVVFYDPAQRAERGWFAGRNLGEPFDSALTDSIRETLRPAGLFPPDMKTDPETGFRIPGGAS